MLGDGYGKIFKQIYAGTLRSNWKALITFEQMIVLCGPDGVIDMPPEVLHNITGIPLDIILDGIAALESPDPRSRSPEHEGRRILRLDSHRDWGWQIVNHQFYRDLASREEQREGARQRKQRQREREKNLSNQASHDMSQDVTGSPACHGTQTHTHTHTQTHITGSEPIGSPPVIMLPLNDKSEYPITEAQLDEFKNLYPSVDVMQALRDMRGWCIANPTKRKTKTGIMRFVTAWLSKEQNRGGQQHGTRQQTDNSVPARIERARQQSGCTDGAINGTASRVDEARH